MDNACATSGWCQAEPNHCKAAASPDDSDRHCALSVEEEEEAEWEAVDTKVGSTEKLTASSGRAQGRRSVKMTSNSKPPRRGTTNAGLVEDGPHGAPEGRQADSSEPNLDSGYAWFILMIMFLLQSSISGSSRCYGIVYAQEVALGYYDRQEASWPIASSSTVENLAGLLTPALTNYLSWRQIELLATLLLISSNLLAYLSDSLWLDILALGLIQGLALSMSTILSLAINNDYFERYRTSAYGISMSGSTFGVLYLSPLVSWLLERYNGNFRLVYLALALVFCANLVLVLFIKPRRETAAVVRKQAQIGGVADQWMNNDGRLSFDDAGQPVRRATRFERNFERNNSIASISHQTKTRRQSTQQQWCQGATVATEKQQRQQDGGQMLAKSQSGIELARKRSSSSTPVKAKLTHQLTLDEVAPTGTFWARLGADHLQQQQQQQQQHLYSSPDWADKKASHNPSGCLTRNTGSSISCLEFIIDKKDKQVTQLNRHEAVQFAEEDLERKTLASQSQPEPRPQPLQPRDQQTGQNDEEAPFTLASLIVLLKTPYLHCTWIMLALYYLIARIFVIILVDFASDHGFSLKQSTSLLNYWSFGELVGRVLLGSLVDLQCISCKGCIALTCSLLAGAIGLMLCVESYYVYAACSTLVAALISLEYMLINVLMVVYIGKKHVTSCYSLAAFICSAVLFVRPTMIGMFRDHLGSYDGLLAMLASLALAYGLLFVALEPIFVAHWPQPSASSTDAPAAVRPQQRDQSCESGRANESASNNQR